jgi:hypothetical protein
MLLGCLGAALVFFAQLAPTLHALESHDEHGSSCKHATPLTHFESAPPSGSEPCPVCAHLSGSQSFFFVLPPRIDEILSVRSSAPSIQLPLDTRETEHPDPRGPPAAAKSGRSV